VIGEGLSARTTVPPDLTVPQISGARLRKTNSTQLNRHKTSQVPTIIMPVVLVTKDNIDSTVIAGGHLTKDQVYGAEAGG
jgi:ABC-type xylose transport system substrate-binding protein